MRYIIIQLPKNDYEHGMCGRLVYSLYGARGAAQNWEREYMQCFESIGFRRGNPHHVHYASKLDARIVVHGDDFTILAQEDTIKVVASEMAKRYKFKLHGIIGPDSWDDKEIPLLNRVFRRTPSGIIYEADPRRAEMNISARGLQDSKPVGLPGVKPAGQGKDEGPLNESGKSQYKALVARASYLAQDGGTSSSQSRSFLRKCLRLLI